MIIRSTHHTYIHTYIRMYIIIQKCACVCIHIYIYIYVWLENHRNRVLAALQEQKQEIPKPEIQKEGATPESFEGGPETQNLRK